MIATFPGLIVLLALGWIAGGCANWMADELPQRGAARAANGPAGQPAGLRRGFTPWHYLTLPWHPFLGGICPHCGQRRPRRVPLLELAIMGAFGLAWWRYADAPGQLAVACLYAAFLLAVLVIDLEHRRVLNVMLAPAAGAALLLSLRLGPRGLLSAVLAAALGFGLFLLLGLLSRGAIGMGDVKLAGVIGLMTGYPAVITALVGGIVLGGLAAGMLLLTRRADRKGTMAYAPYLAVGAIFALLRGG